MTQTLRRELKHKLMEALLSNTTVAKHLPGGEYEILSEQLADAALEVAGIAKQEQPERKPDLVDAVIKYHLGPKAVQNAIRDYFKLTPNWEAKYNKQFMEWAVESNITPEQVKQAADLWRSDKRFNWAAPSLKGIQEHWLELTEIQEPTYRKVEHEQETFAPYSGPRPRIATGSPEAGSADDV